MYFSKSALLAMALAIAQLGAAAPAPTAAPAAEEQAFTFEVRAPFNETEALEARDGELQARQSGNGRFTHYTVGLGACGWRNNNNEHVVAINSVQFDPFTPNGNPNRNTLCGRQIRATSGGKSLVLGVVDRCPGCGWGGLDLSPSAFQFFAPLSTGVIQGSWQFIN